MRANHEAISLADAAILQRPKSTPTLSIRRPLYQWHLWHAMPTAERPMGFAFPQKLNFITKLFTYTNSTQVSSTILWSVPFCGAGTKAAAMSYMKSIHAAKKASEGTMVRNEFEVFHINEFVGFSIVHAIPRCSHNLTISHTSS